MYFSNVLLAITSVIGSAAAVCPAATREASARQVITSYNKKAPGASARGFKKVPWGAPDTAGTCLTTIIPDGACSVPVATTGSGTYDFAVASREVFSHLTGEYVNFDNGTTLINTVVTLGAQSTVPLPVSFIGHVYMDYNDDCRIYSARAYARVPYKVLSEAFAAFNVPFPAEVCGAEP